MESPFQQIHDILWDEDKEETRRNLVSQILDELKLQELPDSIAEFAELIKDVIGEPHKDLLFDQVIAELLHVRKYYEGDLFHWQRTTDSIIHLLHYKMDYSNEQSDQKLIHNLYRSIANTYPENYEDSWWSIFFDGDANSTFNYAKSTQDIPLLHESIELYKKALSFYDKGTFPEHWAVHNMKRNVQVQFANVIMDSYEIDVSSFKNELALVEGLINEATNNYLNDSNNKTYSSGNTLAVEAIDKAQKRYDKIKV